MKPMMPVSETASRERMIIFSRYPEAGHTKTRLIPALGATRAAAIQQALTRLTLSQAATLREIRRVEIEVRFTGGDQQQMADIFGLPLDRLMPQQGQDLGERLQQAVSRAFNEGAARVVTIGTDCPDLDADRLASAFAALDKNDVALGPASDGGYYLIGQRVDRPELFQGVAWGTADVLKQTLEKCRAARLSVHQLGTLSDIDNPEDLLVCRRRANEFSDVFPPPQAGMLSVIVPTLNEAAHLEQTLRLLVDREGVEVIISDGGSSDDTVEIAYGLGVTVIQSQRGRGRQMNAAAALARGEVLLFVHADTRLPERFVDHVWSTLNGGAIAGAFPLSIEESGFALRCVAWAANVRSRYRQMPYGDQCLFLRAADFYRLNGFRHWPLLEDYDLCRRIRREGRIALADEAVITSNRRWRKLGVVRTTAINQMCLAAFHLGVSPAAIARFYRRRNKS